MTARPNMPLYMDYHATTPLDPRVWEVVQPFFTEIWGNPHSAGHSWGWEADAAVEKARTQVAKLIGADAKEIIFTSGATESTNIAIKGAAKFEKHEGGPRNHIITVATEHKCVLGSAKSLKEDGFEVTILGVDRDGMVNLAELSNALRPETLMVSIMAVNNEIGVIQDLLTIGKLCRANSTLFHTDAAQGFGKIPIDVDDMCIDLLSISGHKIYAPKGVGALYVRRRPRVRVEALFHGGGQERDIRSGTVAPALVVGLGMAAEIAGEGMAEEAVRLTKLRNKLFTKIKEIAPFCGLNGHSEMRVPGNLSVHFPGVEVGPLMKALSPDLAVSSSSACSSATVTPSYVLQALGIGDDAAKSTIRFGLGRYTTEDDVTRAAELLASRLNA